MAAMQPPAQEGQPEQHSPQQHEQEVEDKEAFQYWGYLFQPDKTGTDKLKGLLGGLKGIMNEQYDSSDNPDLTPKQLAQFYRELHGDYDRLFLETPSDSIAFIYKSLGCLHSLQPKESGDGNDAQPQSTAFADPTIPALKTEGWVMWQTIQLLLGPEEHSSFLMEAVQKWDIKDPSTGEMYPKFIPRRCFPMEPDKHMVAWYEGVSERLRKEAEEEERHRHLEAQQAQVRRIPDRQRDEDEEGSVDSRGQALAYFRNPLYRHVDGRPSIVRRNSKRPAMSPRPTMMDKGKGAANTMGHVIRNIGSPHLWDGHHSNKSRSRERDHRRRRASLGDNRFYGDEQPPTSAGYDTRYSPSQEHHHHHRRRSSQLERPPTASTDEWNSSVEDPHSPRHSHHHSHREDPELRHSRSHEPTPSQKEYTDYFQGYDDPSRRNSHSHSNTGASGTPPTNGLGMFGPSASPLFASHVAKQPQPQNHLPPPQNQFGPPRKHPSMRRAQERPYSRSPDPSQRLRDDDRGSRRYSSQSRERRRHDSPGSSRPYDDGPPPPGLSGMPHPQPGFPPLGPGERPPPRGYPPQGPPQGRLPSRDRERDRRSSMGSRDMRGGGGPAGGPSGPGGPGGRQSGSDLSAYSGAEEQRPPEDRRKGKQTRFASGVDGRRYPDESGWR